MTTEAQINANRANAQKSTGPRTPEGKEKASRNALTHGLLAKDVVVVGEDLDEFDLFRDQYRAELAPVGIAESLLVERIVGLSWRLQRAERLGTESFDVLYLQCTADPQIKRWRPLLRPEAADPVVGLTVVKDFSETKVLERLMVHERRIENSLYRTMAELRQVQERRQGAGGEPRWDSRSRRSRREEDRRGPFHRVPEISPPDFTLDDLLGQIAASEEGPQTPTDAFGNPDRPADATTNTPADQTCETKPIWPAETGSGDEIRKTNPIPSAAAVDTAHYSSIPSFQHSNARPEAESPSCDIASLPGVVPATNPICGEARGTGIPSAAPSGQALPVGLNHGRAAHATMPEVKGESCKTNPICGGAAKEQNLCGTGVKSDPAPSGSGETKPISARASREQFGYRPIFRRRR